MLHATTGTDTAKGRNQISEKGIRFEKINLLIANLKFEICRTGWSNQNHLHIVGNN